MSIFKKWALIFIAMSFFGCSYSCQKNKPVNDKIGVTEIVIYKTKVGVQRTDHLKKAKAISTILAQQDGFIARQFSQTSDGKWMDIIYWKNLSLAEKAAEAVKNIPECELFFSDIDQKHMEFMYTETLFDYPQEKATINIP